MKKNATKLLSCIALSMALSGPIANVYAQDARVKVNASTIAKHAAQLGFSATDLQNYRISDAYVDKLSGATIVYLQQTFKGVDVFNSIKTVAIKDNKVYSVAGSYINDIASFVKSKDVTAKISAADAVKAAAQHFALSPSAVSAVKTSGNLVEFGKLNISTINVKAKQLWVYDDVANTATLAWQVEFQPLKKSDYWLVNVDALKGTVFSKINLTVSCDWQHPVNATSTEAVSQMAAVDAEAIDTSLIPEGSAYRVVPFPAESPDKIGGKLKFDVDPWKLAGEGNAATTYKWYMDSLGSYDSTRSNNVLAQEDQNGDNGFGLGAHSQAPLPASLYPWQADFAADPTAPQNRKAAITNLFYWNNIMHDVSYQYGFDEVSGNFQNSNLSRGGKGNDFVYADAQDGSGTDNANFGTPSDGSNPRMQMFLWSAVPSFKVLTPTAFAGTKTVTESAFSTNNKLADKGPITGSVVLVNDDATGTLHQGCSTPVNASALAGKIALIDRGTCNFTAKVLNAQNAGAIAAIVVNNVTGAPITMGGTDNTITIPAVMVSLETGDTMKQYLAVDSTVTVTMKAGTRLDGDLDNSIIAHEYTHGISNRLTGGPSQSTCLSNAEQGGEGWSDYMALMVTTNWKKAGINDGANKRPIGTYVLGQSFETGAGIRAYPYSTDLSINPWTYAMMTASGGEVHTIGEIWCATLWDMTWDIIQQTGVIEPNIYNADGTYGNAVALKLVIEGMKLQKCRPGFIDARNGILAADTLLYNGKYSASIWKAFARRGMGVYASEGSANSTSDQVADFTEPAPAQPFAKQAMSVKAVSDKISISPNPAKDFVTVTVPNNTKSLTVTLSSANGQKVSSYIMTNGVKQISLPAVAPGVYYVTISGEGVSYKKSIIIQ